MTSASATFAGPQYYNDCIGPLWFDPFAADLVQRFPERPPGDVLEIACGTGLVTKRLRERLKSQSWLNDAYINVAVNDGVVELWGFVVSADQHRALRALVEETEGVTQVEDKLAVAGPLRGGV